MERKECISTAQYKGMNSPQYLKYGRNWAYCYWKTKIEENYSSLQKRNKNGESMSKMDYHWLSSSIEPDILLDSVCYLL